MFSFIVDSSDAGRLLRISLNITLPNIPCIAASLDYIDAVGSRGLGVSSTIFKERLNFDGSVTDEENDNDFCGSCYGAELYESQCCNSCDEIIAAYKLRNWQVPIENFALCDKEHSEFKPYKSTARSGNHNSESLKNVNMNADESPEDSEIADWVSEGEGRVAPSPPSVRSEEESTSNVTSNKAVDDIESASEYDENELEKGRLNALGNQNDTSSNHTDENTEIVVATGSKHHNPEETNVKITASTNTTELNGSNPHRRLLSLLPTFIFGLPSGFLIDESHLSALKKFKGEGCRLWGFFDAKQVPGEFQIGPGNIQNQAWNQVFGSNFKVEYKIHTLRWTDSLTDNEILMDTLRTMQNGAEMSEGILKAEGTVEQRLTLKNFGDLPLGIRRALVLKQIDLVHMKSALYSLPNYRTLDDSEGKFDSNLVHHRVSVIPTVVSKDTSVNGAQKPKLDVRGYQVTSSLFEMPRETEIDKKEQMFDPSRKAKVGLHFQYDFDPILLKYSKQEESWGAFLITMCGVVGGTFALANFIVKANTLIQR